MVNRSKGTLAWALVFEWCLPYGPPTETTMCRLRSGSVAPLTCGSASKATSLRAWEKADVNRPADDASLAGAMRT